MAKSTFTAEPKVFIIYFYFYYCFYTSIYSNRQNITRFYFILICITGPTAWKLNPAGLSWEYLGTPPNASLFIPTTDDVSWVVGNKMYVFGGGFDYMQFYNGRYYSNYVSSVLYSVGLDKNGSFTYLGGDANSKGQYSGNLWPGAR